MSITLEAHILVEYTLGNGRRQRVNLGADLYPGDVVALMDDPRTQGHWYVLSAHGDATLCNDEADVVRLRDDSDRLFPGHRPHRAVRMAVVAELKDSEVAQSAEQRPHTPQGAGSSPALATDQQEQET